MSWIILVTIGILFDFLVKMVAKGYSRYLSGIDSMPTIPIIAGYSYGISAGILAGLVISLAYCIIRTRISHAPLIIEANVTISLLAALLGTFTFLYVGVLLLIFYHVASFIIMSVFSKPGPGYFSFVFMNFIFSSLLIYFASSFI